MLSIKKTLLGQINIEKKGKNLSYGVRLSKLSQVLNSGYVVHHRRGRRRNKGEHQEEK